MNTTTKIKVCTAALLCAALLTALAGGTFLPLGTAQDTKPGAPSGAPGKGKGVQDTKPRTPGEQTETDEEFIRRMSKDLRGTDPTPAEVHFFVSSKEGEKRQKLIDLFIQERQSRKTGKQNELEAEAMRRLRADLAEAAKKVRDLEGVQAEFFKKLQAAKDKAEVAKLTQDLLDRLIEFVKQHPNSPDTPAAIKTIASLYEAQSKADQAKAWRERLQKQGPGDDGRIKPKLPGR